MANVTHRPWMPGVCTFYPSTQDIIVLFSYMRYAMENKTARGAPFPHRKDLAGVTDTIITNMLTNGD